MTLLQQRISAFKCTFSAGLCTRDLSETITETITKNMTNTKKLFLAHINNALLISEEAEKICEKMEKKCVHQRKLMVAISDSDNG